MERLEISKLFSSYEELGGKEMTVCGWFKTLRDLFRSIGDDLSDHINKVTQVCFCVNTLWEETVK